MSDFTRVPPTPVVIELGSHEFREICGWQFANSYVGRLLRDDIPRRMRRRAGRIWVYRDQRDHLVGFGTIDVNDHYSDYTDGRLHPYIPLLAVNPMMGRQGYGTSIVEHLIGEAAMMAREQDHCYDVLFLDVYTSNTGAITLYEKCGFEKVSDQPSLDPDENNEPYFIMAKRVSVAPA
jgi:ribosomal protein S18 acetylase RimI-like enzyme